MKKNENETAYHEAGHLVADIYYNLKPIEATIISEGDMLGHVSNKNRLRDDYSKEEWDDIIFDKMRNKPRMIFDIFDENPYRQYRMGRRTIISFLAGFASQKKYNPSADIAGSNDDFQQAADIVEVISHYPKKYYDIDGLFEFKRFLTNRFLPQAEKFVNQHWQDITLVAKLMLKHKSLSEKDIVALRKKLRMGKTH